MLGFTLEELKRAGGRLKANTAPRINGVPNEILKEVIVVYPEILLEAFDFYLREGRFFDEWRRQSLVLLRKAEKPLEDASSYRPIRLLDTMGKILEENQFGFRKGRSTVDAIQAVVNIATKARRGTGKRKGFCALISTDIRNAFNTTRWNICIDAVVRKKVPNYLLLSLKEEMTCGAPEGSGVGPLVWNVIYDDFLRLPAGTSIIGFADEALVVCAADDVRILELRINESLWWAERWLDSRCLKMAPEKTEALLVTDRRSFQYPNIVLRDHEVEWKKSTEVLC